MRVCPQAACGILSHWGAQLILTSWSGGASIAIPISQMKTPMLRAAQSLAQHCTTSKGQNWGWSPSFPTLRFSGFFQSSPAVSEWVKEETGTELLAIGCCMAWQGLRPGVCVGWYNDRSQDWESIGAAGT